MRLWSFVHGSHDCTRPFAGDAVANGGQLAPKLIDSLRELQKCNKGMCDRKDELGQKMQQLKGKIPGQQMPPGAAGEDDDEEEPQPGKAIGQKEDQGD